FGFLFIFGFANTKVRKNSSLHGVFDKRKLYFQY
ncbi:MAG: hypothetical protein ACI9ZX_001421, partial [Algoriphagus sp.]